ncbi:hypothetical protein NQ317_010097 [Molorchus minor]|uniref:WW domain-containing protein n=1 Tax=Molorchus minor TaxID=1323400 RepID=A0ABQ9JDS0_9CUCU|nr:hypothetical protein NQ317_010097 [Molorchus minor]
MDATVDDFFNEINEIAPPEAPPKAPHNSTITQSETVWQECYDKLSGYTYYWNTKTDKVTWTTPPELKKTTNKDPKETNTPKKKMYIPPPVFSSIGKPIDNVKIYSIGENSKKETPEKSLEATKTAKHKGPNKKDDSDDEKIELITCYGSDSESESDESKKEPIKKISDRRNHRSESEEDDDDIDILTKIQKRAMELKALGGDLPPEVKNIVTPPPVETKTTPAKEKKLVAGPSLVAGYSDSEEEHENEEIKSIFSIAPEPEKVSHSTLFPITKPIDVKDFIQPSTDVKSKSPTNDFDSKAFQRKRRIGVALVNTAKKKDDVEDTVSERKGFGFSGEENSSDKGKVYSRFQKGGVLFVKSDVLKPTLPKEEMNGMKEQTEGTCDIKREDIEAMYTTLQEKLRFLSEGRPSVSPVQVMVIQAETLFEAMKSDGLKLSYLRKWLDQTCSELIKLEKEAAPEGWLLQWDRSHKRYYYQNQTTGEGQWEYPQPDVDRCDEAMDISTTPPPTEPTIHLSPPLPPIIRSPTPPPPPIISGEPEAENAAVYVLGPLPKFTENGEPLPPGVDLPEIISYQAKEPEPKPSDPLFSALDSFYSEVAAIEETSVASPSAPLIAEELKMDAVEPIKKKRKTKVKLAPGLAMKKKGVSELVEKWKHVQQSYK